MFGAQILAPPVSYAAAQSVPQSKIHLQPEVGASIQKGNEARSVNAFAAHSDWAYFSCFSGQSVRAEFVSGFGRITGNVYWYTNQGQYGGSPVTPRTCYYSACAGTVTSKPATNTVVYAMVLFNNNAMSIYDFYCLGGY